MTREQYLQVLTGFETQLRRHSDPWGNLLLTPVVQGLRDAWLKTAAVYHKEFPDEPVPTPFWEGQLPF